MRTSGSRTRPPRNPSPRSWASEPSTTATTASAPATTGIHWAPEDAGRNAVTTASSPRLTRNTRQARGGLPPAFWRVRAAGLRRLLYADCCGHRPWSSRDDTRRASPTAARPWVQKSSRTGKNMRAATRTERTAPTVRRLERLGRPVDTPDVAQDVADLAHRRPGSQRVAHGIEDVVVALGGGAQRVEVPAHVVAVAFRPQPRPAAPPAAPRSPGRRASARRSRRCRAGTGSRRRRCGSPSSTEVTTSYADCSISRFW